MVTNILNGMNAKYSMQQERCKEFIYTSFPPPQKKLFNLIEVAKHEDSNKGPKHILKKRRSIYYLPAFLSKTALISSTRDRNFSFKRRHFLDLTFLDKLPVLHVVCIQTHFASVSLFEVGLLKNFGKHF